MRARAATIDDAEEVIRLAALMYASIGQDVTDPTWIANAHDAYKTRLGDDLGVFVVDHPDREGLAASGAVTISTRLPAPNNLTARTGYVQWIATDEDARRRGYGRVVMSALMEWCAEHELTVVELHATDVGEPLYRELGFDEGPHPALRIRRR